METSLPEMFNRQCAHLSTLSVHCQCESYLLQLAMSLFSVIMLWDICLPEGFTASLTLLIWTAYFSVFGFARKKEQSESSLNRTECLSSGQSVWRGPDWKALSQGKALDHRETRTFHVASFAKSAHLFLTEHQNRVVALIITENSSSSSWSSPFLAFCNYILHAAG